MRRADSAADAEMISANGLSGSGRVKIAEAFGWTGYRSRQAIEYLSRAAEAARQPEKPKKEKPKPIRISSNKEVAADLEPGIVHRFIVTSVQDDTPVLAPFLENLLAYADDIGAHFFTLGFTYQKGLFEDHAAATAVFAPEVREYMVYDRVRLTPDLLIVADANVLPTAANPLNGWLTSNHGGHVVVPHARIALESIPRMQGQAPRYAVTTGTLTMPSYAPRAAGRKAIQHHTYGALLIEVDADGEVFMRNLIATDERGEFQDLDAFVSGRQVRRGYRVAAMTWGDIHHDQLDQDVALSSFGYDREQLRFVQRDNLLDRLKPAYQFLEDTLDFRWRNHHNIHDPISMARMTARGTVSVEREIREAVAFANGLRRPWCETVLVESNHDSAVAKWLRADDGRYDPDNAHLWHRLNADWHDEIRAANDNFNVTEHAFRRAGLADDILFVRSGGSYIVQDVEHGLHGDLGINGARGTPVQYRRFGRRTTSGHTHSPRIVDGAYVAGVSAKLDQGYNVGPTTWGHAHVVLYPSGARALIMIAADGRYEANGDRTEYTMAA